MATFKIEMLFADNFEKMMTVEADSEIEATETRERITDILKEVHGDCRFACTLPNDEGK